MLDQTGRDSSTLQPSSWADDHHNGPHFTLLTFPDGKLILTTPSHLTEEEFQAIQILMNDWVAADTAYPLVIGNCRVAFARMPPKVADVVRA